MFITRLISGIVVLALAVAMMLVGGNLLFAFVVIISFIGQNEIYKATDIDGTYPANAGYAATAIYEIFIWLGINNGAIMGVATGILLIMAVYVFTFPKYHADKIFSAISGYVYVTVLMSFIYQVRMLTEGLYLIPLIFICAWGNDTCAYCVGMLIGKHKMSPKLSPKKSIEGFVGGIVGAVIIGCIYGTCVGDRLSTMRYPAVACAIIAGVGALIAVVGDLAASAIKRDRGIKDYGKLIPGHGGILDRFDSILFTAPVVYILAVLLMTL